MFTQLHDTLNKWLTPAQGLVTILFVGVAIFSLYMAFVINDPTLRTGVIAWILAP